MESQTSVSRDIASPPIVIHGVAFNSFAPKLVLHPFSVVRFPPTNPLTPDKLLYTTHISVPTDSPDLSFTGGALGVTRVNRLKAFRDGLAGIVAGFGDSALLLCDEGSLRLEICRQGNDCVALGTLACHPLNWSDWENFTPDERNARLRSSPWHFVSQLRFIFLIDCAGLQQPISALDETLKNS
jgi:hypothetical protein